MKRFAWILNVTVACSFMFLGCAKKGSVDTGKLESSFQTSEPATKSKVDSVVSAIKSADYSGAMGSLTSLASDAKLTPEQKQAVTDVLEQVKSALADTANKAADGAQKAVGDMQKALPK